MMVSLLGCFSKGGPCGRQFFHLFGLFLHWQSAYFQFTHINARLLYCTHVLELYFSSSPFFCVRSLSLWVCFHSKLLFNDWQLFTTRLWLMNDSCLPVLCTHTYQHHITLLVITPLWVIHDNCLPVLWMLTSDYVVCMLFIRKQIPKVGLDFISVSL
jgi:hypothetical protein